MKHTLERGYSKRKAMFFQRFSPLLSGRSGSSILCLGARDGVEVDALRCLGLFAIGIDIEYPRDSQHVHYGDFHDIPYPARCVDYAYTNAFDHIFSPETLLLEVRRVLKPEGQFILDLPVNADEGGYESIAWSRVEDVVDLLEELGWNVESRQLTPDRTNWQLALRCSDSVS